jgi:ABC-type uncharacterized transport system substrate-binding protein
VPSTARVAAGTFGFLIFSLPLERPRLVAGGGTPSAMAAKAATVTIPIVFAIAVDPVKI